MWKWERLYCIFSFSLFYTCVPFPQSVDSRIIPSSLEMLMMYMLRWFLSCKITDLLLKNKLFDKFYCDIPAFCADYTSDHPFSMFRRLMSALAPHSYLAMAATMPESALWSPYSRRGASAAIPVCRATKCMYASVSFSCGGAHRCMMSHRFFALYRLA